MLQHSEALTECARGHEEAVIVNDEYRIRELFASDKNIEYIIDLGANLGAAAFKFQTFYPNAKIIVAEPEPELMKYAKLNTNNKLIYEQVAVIGDKRRKVTFNVMQWAGNGHVDGNFRFDLFAPMGSKKVGEIEVKATTLHALMKKHEFPRIDLLKVDTEGMEGQILQAFKPYMHLVKYFRGEWHGDKEIPLIEDALKETHNVRFDRTFSTHGDIFAERKDLKVTHLPAEVAPGVTGNPYGARGSRINARTGKIQYIL